jgi:uncharacterized protein YlzI (FlbEa/FlbD family)
MIELTQRDTPRYTLSIAKNYIVTIEDMPCGVKITPVAGEAFFVEESYEQVREKLAA